MKAVKIAGLYIIAAVLFLWECLWRQPEVLWCAYFNTFAAANDLADKVRRGEM